MSAHGYRQDMPPEGGYSRIPWTRKLPRLGLSGYAIFGIFAGVTTTAWIANYFERMIKRKQKLEMNDARLAAVPLYRAERQRMYLRQLRKNRDEENELMKNVPGWETGKWKGQTLYSDGQFPIIIMEEYFAHCDPKEGHKRSFEHTTH